MLYLPGDLHKILFINLVKSTCSHNIAGLNIIKMVHIVTHYFAETVLKLPKLQLSIIINCIIYPNS